MENESAGFGVASQDKYTRAIQLLNDNPDAIYNTWGYAAKRDLNESFARLMEANGGIPEAACLFASLSNDVTYGCLTLIRCGKANISSFPENLQNLAQKIAGDHRIPKSGNNITLYVLPIFAEYQREADRIQGL
jgi:hypothetical protein